MCYMLQAGSIQARYFIIELVECLRLHTYEVQCFTAAERLLRMLETSTVICYPLVGGFLASAGPIDPFFLLLPTLLESPLVLSLV